MLQKIHDKVSGWFAGVLLGLLAVVFIFWGIDFGFRGMNYGAKVNGEKIRIEDLRRAYQNQVTQFQQIYRGELPEQLRTGLQNDVMEGFIRNELIVNRSHDLGFRVSDAQVLKTYEEIPQFQIDGKYSPDVAERMLRSQGISPVEFEAQQRRYLQASQLQNAIAASSFATPAEIERHYQLQKEEREAAWVTIPAAHFAARIQPTDADIQKYYDQNKQMFKTDETVTLRYVRLRLEDVGRDVKATDAELKTYFDTVKERYAEPEQRRAHHILIQVADSKAEEAARKKAEELLVKAKAAGADFEKLAKENSQDAGSAAKGGDLGFAPRTTYVGPFADALFDMKAGEIRGPVRTEFGYHIIRLDEVRAGAQKSFEEVRAEIERDYRKQEAEKQFGERQEQLANKSFEKLNDLDAVAKEMGLTVQEIPLFSRNAAATPAGDLASTPQTRAKLVEAAFAENVINGENSQPIELEPGDVVVVRVANHKMPQQKPLAAVRDTIITSVRKQQSEAQAQQLASQSAQRLTAGAEQWGRLDNELKTKSEGPKYVNRDDSAMPSEVRNALFSLPRPTGKTIYRAVTLGNGDAALLAFSNARLPQAAESADDRKTAGRQLSARLGESEMASYIGQLRREAKIVKNPKAFE